MTLIAILLLVIAEHIGAVTFVEHVDNMTFSIVLGIGLMITFLGDIRRMGG